MSGYEGWDNYSEDEKKDNEEVRSEVNTTEANGSEVKASEANTAEATASQANASQETVYAEGTQEETVRVETAQEETWREQTWQEQPVREQRTAWEAPRYTYEEAPKKKKKEKALPYILAFALIIGLGLGAFFGVRALIGKPASKTEVPRVTTTNDKTDKGQNTETPTVSTKDDAAKEVTLSKNDVNSVVGTTETTGAGIVVTDVSGVVENVMPSLVAVTDNLEVTQSYNPYSFYFGQTQGSQSSSYETASSASGVIIGQSEKELLIVTNNHVVDNSGSYSSYTISSTGITVQFVDDSTAPASVKGVNEDWDLAVLAVKLSDLSEETLKNIRIAVIGSSDDTKVGEGVICIGNALGYGQSVTSGIISQKERPVTIDGVTRYLLQTDAAINYGNSGGGMFNAKGELIGINESKNVQEAVEGTCFAIPISAVEDVIEELMNAVTVPVEEQGYIGVNGETVPSSYVERYGYPAGVSITRIIQGSPADAAGLQLYDIVTAVNGKEVTTYDEMKEAISQNKPGTSVEFSIMRPEGRSFTEMTITITTISREAMASLS